MTVRWWSFEARLLYDGDGTDDRTGRPAVTRGRREQDRSRCGCSTSSAVSSGALGEGVGLRTRVPGVRQWGSKPDWTQDGRRDRLPEVALCEATSSSRYQQYKRQFPFGK